MLELWCAADEFSSLANCADGEPGSGLERGGDDSPEAELGDTARTTTTGSSPSADLPGVDMLGGQNSSVHSRLRGLLAGN